MNQHRGTSLISLMVGLLITSITMMAMLSVYKDSLRMVLSSTVSAFDNSDRLAGAMLSNRILQGAGFGLPDADPDVDLVFLQGGVFQEGQLYDSASEPPVPQKTGPNNQPPALDGGEGTYIHTGVVWGSVIDGNNRCEGLVTIATSQGHGLLHLTSNADCDQAENDWTGIQWTSEVLSWHRYLSNDGLSPSDDQWITLDVDRAADCWPFGKRPEGLDVSSPISVTLSFPVFNVKGIPRREVQSSSCLVNFS